MIGLDKDNDTVEKERLSALSEYIISETESVEQFDAITRLASYICKTPIALISLVDEYRQLFISKIGIEGTHTLRQDTLCQFTILNDDVLEIPDIADNEFYRKIVAQDHGGLRFYAGAPLINPDGYRIGTLCVADIIPHQLHVEQRDALQILSREVITHLEAAKKNRELQAVNESREEMFSLFNNSPELHAILDRAGTILMINNSVERLLGYTIEEVIGKNIWSYCVAGDRERVMPGIEQGLANGETYFELETRVITKSGEIKWFGWNDTMQKGRWLINGRDITNQKQIISDLELLSLAASKTSSGLVIRNAKNEVLWANNAFEEITGFSLQELKGTVLGDIMIGEGTNSEILSSARQLLSNHKSYEIEILLYKKDKTPVWVYMCNNFIFNELNEIEKQIAIIVDISERKKSDQQLQLLSLVASKTVNGVSITNENGLVDWVNDAYKNITGYCLEDIKGRRPSDLLEGDGTNVKELERAKKLSEEQKPFNLELLNYRKDGEPVWLSISNTPVFDENNKLIHQVEIVNDITERKYHEFELVMAKEEALQLSKAKEMFLSVMSHEIRTPLNAVLGLSRILQEENTSPSQAESLNLLKFSAENLMALINDILDLTKIETGNLELENIDISIKELVSKTLNSLQFKVVEKGVVFKSEIDERIPDIIKGDETRLYQIMMNLLGNAVKFTHQGEIKLKLDLVNETTESIALKFEISDTGIGIAEDKLGQIFEVYKQAGADTSRKYGGTGLGLSITKRLVELHHSEIYVNSTVGKGTKFFFTINFKKSNPTIAGQTARIERKLYGKVLVADDNQINCYLARKVLSKWGISVDFAENGKVAIDKVLSNTYDLILMDIQMPEINGFEATKAIRSTKNPLYIDLPVIALTASALTNEVEAMEEAGMNGHVLKPFVPADLYDKIEVYFRKELV